MEKAVLTKNKAAPHTVICVVVCFNSSQKLRETIEHTLLQVDHIVIVDNNSCSKEKLFLQNLEKEYLSQVTFIFNNQNIQFAAGMNLGIKTAISLGAEYILQLNDDNFLSEGAVDSMLNCFELLTSRPIGIVAPTVLINQESKFLPSDTLTDYPLIASAGMLIPATLFKDFGYYDEDLVIGYDDYDFSLRVINLGYCCLTTGNAALFANLGRMERKSLLTKGISVFNYSPIRRYYAARNGVFLLRRWKRSKELWRWVLWWEINSMVGIVFFEKNKLKKISYTFIGYFDGFRKKMGFWPRLD